MGGLASFSDPTPWQRLSRDQQEEFNRKYLALSPQLQDFSKSQFTSLPEDRQEHAFNMFLQLDLETLSQVISNELVRQTEAQEQKRIAEERQRLAEEQERQRRLEILRARQEFEQGNRFQEVPRNQAATNFNRVAPRQQFQQQQPAPQFNPQQQQRPNFDPRRRQPVQQPQRFQPRPQLQTQDQFSLGNPQPQRQPQPQPTEQELRHFARAEAQISEAVRLQNCLA